MSLQKTYEYIIIGAGITGLSAGRRLQQMGKDNFLILEGESEIGGLCRTVEIDGHVLDVGGGHVLHSRFPEVLDWIFAHIPKEEFNSFQTKVFIELEGHDIQFPLELHLWQLPTDLQIEYLHSYLTAAAKEIQYENFESWIRNYLGDKIADNYMIPYNRKLWCMDISRLNTDWLIKIPATDIPLVLRSIIERNSNFTESVVSHRNFLYPKQGGFQTVVNRIANSVMDQVVLGLEVSSLRYLNKEQVWLVNETYRSEKIINTGPWTKLNIELNDFDFDTEFKNLEHLSDVISLWEREPYSHDAHWKYIPSEDVEQHREFYIHNFAPHSKPGGVMTDINRVRWLQNDKKWRAGKPIYEHENIYAYPLPTKNYKESMERILNYSRDFKLFGLGRWGQWQYFNSDQCIKQVLEFFKDEDNFDYYGIF
jgi:protoporphyrinogen oxidase